jgi:hypothetical protein
MPLISTLSNASARGYRIFAAGEINSYESIQTITLGSNQSTVDFTSIAGTYKHLQLRLITRNNRNSQLDGLYMRFNSDSGTNYSDHFVRGDGANVDANADVSASYMLLGTVAASNAGANVFAGSVIDILDYADTNKYKTVRALLGYDNNGNGYIGLFSGNWRSTTSITSITLGSTNGSGILANSTFALYGIKG